MGGKSSTSTSSVQIPPDVLARYNAVNAQAADVAKTPFQSYGTDPSAFVAPLTAEQNAGIAGTNTYAEAAQPYFGAATNQLLQAQGATAAPLAQAASNTGYAQGVGGAYGAAATQGVLQSQGSAQPFNQAAAGYIGNAAGSAAPYQGVAAGMTLAGAGPANLGGLDTGQYLSPYLANVMQTLQASEQNQNQQEQSALQGSAIQAGAFGGDRSGIAQANLARQQALANNQTNAAVLQQGFTQAQNIAQGQQGAQLSAQQANLARMQGAGAQIGALGQQQFGQQVGAGTALEGLGNQVYTQGLGSAQALGNIGQQQFGQNLTTAQQQAALAQQGYATGANTATALAGFGQGAQAAGLQGAQAQQAAGATQQQTNQAGTSALYNQFLQQQAYPFQTAQFLANIAEGTGALSGSTTSTTQPSSFFSDERLKEDIHPIGETYDGQKIIRFRYKGEKGTQIGLSAQNVEKHHPEAVGESSGFKTVDYDAATRDAAERGHYAAGGLAGVNDNDMAAILQAQQQMYGGLYGGSPHATPGKAGYVPAAPQGAAPRLMVSNARPAAEPSGAQQFNSAVGLGENVAKAYGAADAGLFGTAGKGDAEGTTGLIGAGGKSGMDQGWLGKGLNAVGLGGGGDDLNSPDAKIQTGGSGGMNGAELGSWDLPELANGGGVGGLFDDSGYMGGMGVDDRPHDPAKPLTASGSGGGGGQSGASGVGSLMSGIGALGGLVLLANRGGRMQRAGGGLAGRPGYATDGSVDGGDVTYDANGNRSDSVSYAPPSEQLGLAAAGVKQAEAAPPKATQVQGLAAATPATAEAEIKPMLDGATSGEDLPVPPIPPGYHAGTAPAPAATQAQGLAAAPMPPVREIATRPAAPAAPEGKLEDTVWDRMLGAESGHQQFRSDGSTITSSKGAIGIAQVMPTTGPEAAELAGLPWDPQKLAQDPTYNAALGRAYYNKQRADFGDPVVAAAAYNAGPGRVREAQARAAKEGGTYVDYLPAETRDYIAKVGSATGAPVASGASGAPGGLAGNVAEVQKVLSDPSVPAEDKRDWMQRHQEWLVPLLSGLGGMAASPSRYLGSAMLQGLGAAAGSYEKTQNDLSERAKQAAETTAIPQRVQNTQNQIALQSLKYLTEGMQKSIDPSTGQVVWKDNVTGRVMSDAEHNQRVNQIGGLISKTAPTSGLGTLVAGAPLKPPGVPVPVASAPASAPAAPVTPATGVAVPVNATIPSPSEDKIANPMDRPSVLKRMAQEQADAAAKAQSLGIDPTPHNRLREEYASRGDDILNGKRIPTDKDGNPVEDFKNASNQREAQASLADAVGKQQGEFYKEAVQFQNTTPERVNLLKSMATLAQAVNTNRATPQLAEAIGTLRSIPGLDQYLPTSLSTMQGAFDESQKYAITEAFRQIQTAEAQKAPRTALVEAMQTVANPSLAPEARYSILTRTLANTDRQGQLYNDWLNAKMPDPAQFSANWNADPAHAFDKFLDKVHKETPMFAGAVPLPGNPDAQPTTQSPYREGQTATGPNGAKIVYRDGKWGPL